jgi:hypothetical protein
MHLTIQTIKKTNDMILESYDEFVNETRSENSKIAKKSKTSKEVVDKIREELDNIDSDIILKELSKKTDIDINIVKAVINSMKRTLGGDISVNVKL